MQGTYRRKKVVPCEFLEEEDAKPDNARLICALGRLGHDRRLVALSVYRQHDAAPDVHSHLEIFNRMMSVIPDPSYKILRQFVTAQLTEEVIVVCKDIFSDLFRSTDNPL